MSPISVHRLMNMTQVTVGRPSNDQNLWMALGEVT